MRLPLEVTYNRERLHYFVSGTTMILVLEKTSMPSNDVNFRGRLLRLAAADNVAVATVDFPAGAAAPLDDGTDHARRRRSHGP